MTPVYVMLAAMLPVVILLPFQIFTVLKAKKVLPKLIPGIICTCYLLCVLLFSSAGGLWKLLLTIYGILLLILCGVGWIIAGSILKSQRKK